MHGTGMCMVGGWQGGMHGKGHAWQGGVHGMHGGVTCMAGGMRRGRQPLQWTVRILLECILVLVVFFT